MSLSRWVERSSLRSDKSARTRNWQLRRSVAWCNTRRRAGAGSAPTGPSTRNFGQLYKKCSTKVETTETWGQKGRAQWRRGLRHPSFENRERWGSLTRVEADARPGTSGPLDSRGRLSLHEEPVLHSVARHNSYGVRERRLKAG